MLILPFDNLLHPYLQWNTEVYIGLSMHEKCPYRSSFGLYFLDSQDKSPYLVHEMHEKTEKKYLHRFDILVNMSLFLLFFACNLFYPVIWKSLWKPVWFPKLHKLNFNFKSWLS